MENYEEIAKEWMKVSYAATCRCNRIPDLDFDCYIMSSMILCKCVHKINGLDSGVKGRPSTLPPPNLLQACVYVVKQDPGVLDIIHLVSCLL